MGKSNNQLATAPAREPSVALMLQGVIDKGVTAENAAVMEQMLGLYERIKDRDAKREFNEALALLQSEMPKVKAMKPVPDKHGNTKYKYAPYEEIMAQAQPFLTQHGFSVRFNSRIENGRVIAICRLSHKAGHSEDSEFGVRAGHGPPNATAPQADMSGMTFAKRGALCNALNISIEHDDDCRAIGTPIEKELADKLEARCKAARVNIDAFLKFAGATDFASITQERFPAVEEMLKKKEAKGNAEDWL